MYWYVSPLCFTAAPPPREGGHAYVHVLRVAWPHDSIRSLCAVVCVRACAFFACLFDGDANRPDSLDHNFKNLQDSIQLQVCGGGGSGSGGGGLMAASVVVIGLFV